MRIYYHIYPTCPVCYEPHVNGFILEKKPGYPIRCSFCDSYFSYNVNLVENPDKFPKTVDAINKIYKENKVNDYLKNLPLPWKIKPNIIEEEYINWVTKVENGKFLITWPWMEVKFIPLLVSEYLLSKTDKKVAVIANLHTTTNPDEKVIEAPSIDEIFNKIIYLELSELKSMDEDILREMNRFNKKYIISKKQIVYYRIKKPGNIINENVYDGTMSECKKMLIKECGNDAIKVINEKYISGKNKEISINQNGFIKISLEEREQWMGEISKIDSIKKWLWEIIMNSEHLIRLKSIIPSISLNDLHDIKPSNNRLFFISSDMETAGIFEILRSIKPDMVIFQNVDDFVGDTIFKGEKSRLLFEFIKESENSVILMFSTKPDIRHLYGINYGGNGTESITRYNVIPHTWDSGIILEKIRNSQKNEIADYSTPVTSIFDTIKNAGVYPEFEYIPIESLDELDNFISKIESITDISDNMKMDLKRYVIDIKKTPLIIIGDYTKPEIFRRKGKDSGEIIQFDYIMSSIIHQRCDNDTFKNIEALFDKIFKTNSSPVNPIFEKMNEKIEELIKNQDAYITVIVHKNDIAGTGMLLKYLYVNNHPEKIKVCTWSDLPRRDYEVGGKSVHYVISTLSPSIEYSLSSSHIKKVIFIGGKKFIEKIRTIINNRLDNHALHPLYLLSDKDQAPSMLKKILKEIDISSNKVIQDLTEEIIMDYNEDMNRKEYPRMNYSSYHQSIKAGDMALLVIDINGNGVFIPEGASLLIRDDEKKLTEVEIDDISSTTKISKGKELLLDRHEIYSSFRANFIKLMIKYGGKIKFKKGNYSWDGFISLFKDSIQWIEKIRYAIDYYSQKMEVPHDVAENKISEYLSSIGITAKDPAYIIKWWNRYNIISTENGIFSIYMVEHPKSRDDILKIYGGIHELIPELAKIEEDDTYRWYYASILIQNFRRSLLKKTIEEIDPAMLGLYRLVERDIRNMVDNLETFKVNGVYTVKISKECKPYVVLEKFDEFIKK
ncbi:MAG: hypothetical protein ACP5RZ_04790 [Thermoplasmata archaeon]